MALIVAAICDPDVINQCSNEDMKLQLGLELVDTFVQLLKGLLCPSVILPDVSSVLCLLRHRDY